jgi:hypothetical protein
VKRRKKKTMKGMCSDNKSSSRKIGSLGNDDVWMRTLDIIVIEERKKKEKKTTRKKTRRRRRKKTERSE